MGHDHRRQLRDAHALEVVTELVAVGPAVHQHGLAVGRIEQDRVALADVKHGDSQAGRRGLRIPGPGTGRPRVNPNSARATAATAAL